MLVVDSADEHIYINDEEAKINEAGLRRRD